MKENNFQRAGRLFTSHPKMKTKEHYKEEMKKDKKIILWEVKSFPAIEIKSREEEREIWVEKPSGTLCQRYENRIRNREKSSMEDDEQKWD